MYIHHRQNPRTHSAVRPLMPLLIIDTLSVEISRGKLFRPANVTSENGPQNTATEKFLRRPKVFNVCGQTNFVKNVQPPQPEKLCWLLHLQTMNSLQQQQHCPLLCRRTRHNTKQEHLPTITYCSNNQLWLHNAASVNHLTPDEHYSGRTASLTSKRGILYIYSTNIGTEYFKNGIYSPCLKYVIRRQGRRRKKLLDDLKDRRGYCELKEEALDRTVWRK